jgi:outer membrane protein assembly factor BamB
MVGIMLRRAAIAGLCAVLLLAGCSGGPPAGPDDAAPGAGPAAPAGTEPLTPWPSYHGDLQRTGVALEPATPPSAPSTEAAAPEELSSVTIALDGAVYASPIVAGSLLVVATEHNSVYGMQADGPVRWHVNLGDPTPRSALPCGNIDPLGITGTPVYDEGSDTVFVVASLGPSADHELFALDADTGKTRWQRSVDLPGVDRSAMQQRGALTLTGGRVWVPFGGLAGDCGNYRGRVVGVPVGDGTPQAFTVPTGREGGIWTPPGPAVYRGDLLVAVGNGESTAEDAGYDHSDSVLRLHGTTLVDSFSPSSWASDNASDLDLGSQGPALVQDRWVFQAGKSGIAYVLRADHLGGIGGEVSSAPLCRSFGGTAVDGDVVFVPCTDGVRAVRITGEGTIQPLWRAEDSVTGSPVVWQGRVYALDPAGGTLAVLDQADGHILQTVAVGKASRFATPAISGGRIFIGTLTGLSIVAG